ncbi:IS66 Orf2 family protein [Desulfofarcimen acetoxidans DSM 771]|uniref:IS66 Orf2 family protein n=1 Tax=Desulfofarcimen acetoxidans (strain ATCC 49208 / DSM 771 / KCTC 5769 / VKM B-1644 / 5575) TaxID=485916 RepID=C8VVJ4_DESAS|nr:IS66 family insertion sequence element accessory protein TnpB [Desulfofarcimen acetoxidans]ACV62309.1 IS66 Orf2 family protein [Desulfofarcimen acetoxidans DSM 771]
MLKDITSYDGIFLACGVTDLRRSVDGLAIMVKQQFNMDPFKNHLFLFCNRSRNRLKGLSWDKNGFVLYYKRLDGAGARFKWPKKPTDVRNITVKQLQLLMEGMSIDPPRGFGEITARNFY